MRELDPYEIVDELDADGRILSENKTEFYEYMYTQILGEKETPEFGQGTHNPRNCDTEVHHGDHGGLRSAGDEDQHMDHRDPGSKDKEDEIVPAVENSSQVYAFENLPSIDKLKIDAGNDGDEEDFSSKCNDDELSGILTQDGNDLYEHPECETGKEIRYLFATCEDRVRSKVEPFIPASEIKLLDTRDDRLNLAAKKRRISKPVATYTFQEDAFGKRSFHVGSCYHHKNEDGSERVLAIMEILVGDVETTEKDVERKITCLCRVVLPIEETILHHGYGEACSFEFCCAVHPVQDPLVVPLFQLGKLDEECPKMPEIIHELPTSRCFSGFSFRFDEKRIKRAFKGHRNEFDFVDLFSGAGGMSLGLQEAGFSPTLNIELKPDCNETLKGNGRGLVGKFYNDTYDEEGNENRSSISGDVSHYLDMIQENEGNRRTFEGVPHLHASPPCQGLSQANRYGGKNDIANNRLSYEFVRAVRLGVPLTGSYENVVGLLLEKNRTYLFEMVDGLLALGYQVRCCILNSSHYGDAQERERVFLLISKKGIPLPATPPPTHGEPPLRPVLTASDALGYLPDPYDDVVHGEDVKEIIYPNHSRYAKRDLNNPDMRHLHPDKPAGTVKASTPLVHYNGKRCITVREAACLQSFPLDYEFYGTQTQQYSQVGNAVPVRLAYAVAESIKASLREIWEVEEEVLEEVPEEFEE